MNCGINDISFESFKPTMANPQLSSTSVCPEQVWSWEVTVKFKDYFQCCYIYCSN